MNFMPTRTLCHCELRHGRSEAISYKYIRLPRRYDPRNDMLLELIFIPSFTTTFDIEPIIIV